MKTRKRLKIGGKRRTVTFMFNEPEHTPTPWKLVFDKYLSEGYQEPTIEAKGFKVVARVERVNIDVAEQMANAAFIVRATNEYTSLKAENTKLQDSQKELVQAVKYALQFMDASDAKRELEKAVAKSEDK